VRTRTVTVSFFSISVTRYSDMLAAGLAPRTTSVTFAA